jgi:hypothetical protein
MGVTPKSKEVINRVNANAPLSPIATPELLSQKRVQQPIGLRTWAQDGGSEALDQSLDYLRTHLTSTLAL